MLERYDIAHEIVLTRLMLQVLDFAARRRHEAVRAGVFGEDMCAYDVRLEEWGVQGQKYRFANFLNSDEGKELFTTRKLFGTVRAPAPVNGDHAVAGPSSSAPPLTNGAAAVNGVNGATINGVNGVVAVNGVNGHHKHHKHHRPPAPPPGSIERAALVSGMCERRRCKPHSGWFSMHVRHLRYTIRQLAGRSRSCKQREKTIVEASAERYLRNQYYERSIDRGGGGGGGGPALMPDGGGRAFRLDKDGYVTSEVGVDDESPEGRARAQRAVDDASAIVLANNARAEAEAAAAQSAAMQAARAAARDRRLQDGELVAADESEDLLDEDDEMMEDYDDDDDIDVDTAADYDAAEHDAAQHHHDVLEADDEMDLDPDQDETEDDLPAPAAHARDAELDEDVQVLTRNNKSGGGGEGGVSMRDRLLRGY